MVWVVSHQLVTTEAQILQSQGNEGRISEIAVAKDSALPQSYSSKTKTLWYRYHLRLLLQ
jgi:hypothetical protein